MTHVDSYSEAGHVEWSLLIQRVTHPKANFVFLVPPVVIDINHGRFTLIKDMPKH